MFEKQWPRVKLASVALAIKDGSHGTHKRVERGVPFLSAKNITKRRTLLWGDQDDMISEQDYVAICASFSPRQDDLLLTVVGTLGRSALFDGSRVAFQRSVAFIRPDTRQIHPRFLLHAVGAQDFCRQLVRRSNATAQAGLYLGELAKTDIPMPPLEDQRRIASSLDAMDETISCAEMELAKLNQVKNGLLTDLLTGRVRVPETIRATP